MDNIERMSVPADSCEWMAADAPGQVGATVQRIYERATSSQDTRPVSPRRRRRASTPGASADPGARSTPVDGAGANGCFRVSRVAPPSLLRAPDVCDASIRARSARLNLRLAHGWGHSEIASDARRSHALSRRTTRGEDVIGYPRGHRATMSSHSTRANATRALLAPLRTASRLAQRPVASVRFIECIAAATSAHRSHGEPSLVIRP